MPGTANPESFGGAGTTPVSSTLPVPTIDRDLLAELADALAKIESLHSDNAFLERRYKDIDAFASSARLDLAALRESEAIARSQAKDGVALLQGTLLGRITMLEGEVTRLQRQNEILVQQARLTGDDVRERANRAPEMEEEVARWRRRAGNAEREVERLKEVLENLEDAEYNPEGTASKTMTPTVPVPATLFTPTLAQVPAPEHIQQ
jgi:chromosome segregation ATPase